MPASTLVSLHLKPFTFLARGSKSMRRLLQVLMLHLARVDPKTTKHLAPPTKHQRATNRTNTACRNSSRSNLGIGWLGKVYALLVVL
jgi:hypothetical protein